MSAQIVLTNLDLFNKIAVEKTKLKYPKFKENINKHRQNNIEELKLYLKLFNEFPDDEERIVGSYWDMIWDAMNFSRGIPKDLRKLCSIAMDNTDKIWNQEEGGDGSYTLSGYPNPWRY
tara:strand:- start:299 stop:655 length:357 start_codon:yes stop_codon:yes gene_type:complete